VVGIGDFAVSDNPADVVVTHALGSCIAVCVFDPVARVAGLLHFLLPDSRINPTRAQEQPAAFADTGVPLLLRAAYRLGAQKQRCLVHLVGGADVTTTSSNTFNVGRRNLLAARNALWRSGVLIKGEEVGGLCGQDRGHRRRPRCHSGHFRTGKGSPGCDGEDAMNDEGTPAPGTTADEPAHRRRLVDDAQPDQTGLAITGRTLSARSYEAGNGREALDVLETTTSSPAHRHQHAGMSGTELLRSATPRSALALAAARHHSRPMARWRGGEGQRAARALLPGKTDYSGGCPRCLKAVA
jgi:chemotaxis protein CheD